MKRQAHVAPSERLILIEPTDGSKVTSPVAVRGFANVMEGNVVIERLKAKDEWETLGVTMAGMGSEREMFGFLTTVSLAEGQHHLRVCADPMMFDERDYESCVEIDLVVLPNHP